MNTHNHHVSPSTRKLASSAYTMKLDRVRLLVYPNGVWMGAEIKEKLKQDGPPGGRSGGRSTRSRRRAVRAKPE